MLKVAAALLQLLLSSQFRRVSGLGHAHWGALLSEWVAKAHSVADLLHQPCQPPMMDLQLTRAFNKGYYLKRFSGTIRCKFPTRTHATNSVTVLLQNHSPSPSLHAEQPQMIMILLARRMMPVPGLMSGYPLNKSHRYVPTALGQPFCSTIHWQLPWPAEGLVHAAVVRQHGLQLLGGQLALRAVQEGHWEERANGSQVGALPRQGGPLRTLGDYSRVALM